MAIEVATTRVGRTVEIVAELTERSDPPPYVHKLYSSLVIAPDRVIVYCRYDEETSAWQVDRFNQPQVFGPRVLGGGRLSKIRSDTPVSRETAPWVFEWADEVVATLNDYPAAKLPPSLLLTLTPPGDGGILK